jgi:hypothetical protein
VRGLACDEPTYENPRERSYRHLGIVLSVAFGNQMGGKVRAQHACHTRLGKKPLIAPELAPSPRRQAPRHSDGPAREVRIRAGGVGGDQPPRASNFQLQLPLCTLLYRLPRQIFPGLLCGRENPKNRRRWCCRVQNGADPRIQTGTYPPWKSTGPVVEIFSARADYRVMPELTASYYMHCRQCFMDGPGVPSDQVPDKTIKTVTRSSGSSPAITGEPGRLAPQLFTALPETKNMRWGCQLMSSSLRYCCFAIM